MLLAVSVPAKPNTSMYWRRDFHGKADQVRLVRAFAAHLLADFPGLDDVLLVLDELAVNAVRHTRSGDDGGRFTVEISMDVAGVHRLRHRPRRAGPPPPARHHRPGRGRPGPAHGRGPHRDLVMDRRLPGPHRPRHVPPYSAVRGWPRDRLIAQARTSALTIVGAGQ